MKGKTTIKQKIILITLGIIFTFVVLEIGLRVGGAVFFLLQDKYNKTGPGEFRIMCLGESTTGLGGPDSYPMQLEYILNKKFPKININVINKGKPGQLSGDLLYYLDNNLDRYKPDIVIIMMGVNDAKYYSDKPANAVRSFKVKYIDHMRVYRLVNLSRLHLKHLFMDMKIKKDQLRKTVMLEKPIILKETDDQYLNFTIYHPVTIVRYNEMVNKILDRGINVVVMQYPRCTIDYLRGIFKRANEITFVENKNNFNNMLQSHEPKELFFDTFATSFGHCTRFGNEIIAKNVADNISAIIEESAKEQRDD